MLEDVYKSYRRSAEAIDWKSYNHNDLFKKYIEHENDELANNFFAAIMCRYWGHSGRIYTQCNRHVSFEECYTCIVEAARYVLKKRVWENENSSLYGDPNGPDKAMHIAMKREKGIMLSKYTAQRRMSNFNTLSIDEAHENFKDSADGLLFDDVEYYDDSSDPIKLMLLDYFKSSPNKCLEGIIIDSICFNLHKYSLSKLIKYVKSVRKEDFSYYYTRYEASKNVFDDTIDYIDSMSIKLLKNKIKALLYSLRRGMYKND